MRAVALPCPRSRSPRLVSPIRIPHITNGDAAAQAVRNASRELVVSMTFLRRGRYLAVALSAIWLTAGVAPSRPHDELVMFEQAGCPYCAAWDREIGTVYAKTDEAHVVPLRRVDIHAPRPADLKDVELAHFTPTFVVMHCGREFARITGYISQDQFWGLLDASLKQMKESSPCPV